MLKTLKDILEKNGVDFDEGNWTESGDTLIDLRQEAIKWIKELYKESFITNPKLNNKELTNSKAHTISWIKHFFNITEEDLE